MWMVCFIDWRKVVLVVMSVISLWGQCHMLMILNCCKGLRKLVKIFEQYADEYDIQFNGTKSKYMVYIGRNCDVYYEDIYVNGEKVEQVTTADHLGHRLSTTDKNSMITAAVGNF
jgi:hypothetical protein